ncbi:hypothetical protein ACFXKR_37075 [Streptomyces violascens]|uniref:hypothetical protein n=1 Tax=Streptomyces violascens TaxID=67381 RepID=UPI0036835AE1
MYAARRVGSVCGVPVLAMGGVAPDRDRFEIALTGTSTVAAGTTIPNGPSALLRSLAELESVLAGAGFTSWREAAGRVDQALSTSGNLAVLRCCTAPRGREGGGPKVPGGGS